MNEWQWHFRVKQIPMELTKIIPGFFQVPGIARESG